MAVAAFLAQAHAIVVSSQPAAGAVVRQKDTAIELRFNSRIDHRRSRLFLVRPDGTRSELVILDPTRPDIVAARATELAPGSYRVRWQVLSVDGHITRGDIPFSVAK
jgi:hypothetical protein